MLYGVREWLKCVGLGTSAAAMLLAPWIYVITQWL